MCKCESEISVRTGCCCSKAERDECSDTIAGGAITGCVLGALAGGPVGLLVGAILGAVGGAMACDDEDD